MQNPIAALRLQRGITLLELLIVVVIVAIIASFGYPSYMRYVVNTKRTAATSTLLQVADRQQQFFMDNKRYTATLTELGFAANPMFISDQGDSVPAGDDDAVYLVSLVGVTPTTYTAFAAPLGAQLERDGGCGTMTLNQAGAKGALGGGDYCW
jgi:type IV pilus assembly protein PilE